MLTLRQALRLKNSQSVAFVGAGGKTTAMFLVAREFASALVTVTTHLGAWQVSLADTHIVWESGQPLPAIQSHGITLITGKLDPSTGRYNGLKPDQMESLRQFSENHNLPLLIEADGSRQKPLKAPAKHEPVIPQFVEIVVLVTGLAGLGKKLDSETVHRPELFSVLSGLQTGALITTEALVKALTNPQGGLKGIPTGARKVVLLNQADDFALQSRAGAMANSLLTHFDAVLVAGLKNKQVFVANESTAGIILAAGEASRYGQTKQLLDFHGEPFVRKVAKTALAAGLSPVIVVTGANAEAVEATVHDLPISIARNENWKDGQSASIKTGLNHRPTFGSLTSDSTNRSQSWRNLADKAGSAIFLLADQPQVSQHVLRALTSRHAEGLFPIVAPLIADRRGNPVLFDQVTFPELLKLEGDVGGRALFRNHPVEYIPWHDESLLFDVDNEDDYRKLLAWGVED